MSMHMWGSTMCKHTEARGTTVSAVGPQVDTPALHCVITTLVEVLSYPH